MVAVPDEGTKGNVMTTEGLSGILPAVKYRVPTKHLRASGSTAVFVLPAQFAGYMRLAGVGPRSALRNSDLEAIGQATRLEVIQGVPTISVELDAGQTVPDTQLQSSFKINRKPGAEFYYLLQSITAEPGQQPRPAARKSHRL